MTDFFWRQNKVYDKRRELGKKGMGNAHVVVVLE
jgi:hypothetical protein